MTPDQHLRQRRVVEMRSQGISFTEIGKCFGVSAVRARQIFNNQPTPSVGFAALSKRTTNALKSVGLHSLEELRVANITSVYGLGKVGLVEIENLLRAPV
jgi:hypothetical protein